jgi:hypothetical protein
VLRVLLVSTVLSTAALLPTGRDPTFKSERCHIAFTYPARWMVVRDSSCVIELAPRDWKRREARDRLVGLHTIYITVYPQRFGVALRHTGFRRVNGKWIVGGRHDAISPARTFEHRGWRGVRGSPMVGCEDRAGHYAGLCDFERAFVGNDSRSALLDGGPQTGQALEQIIRSFTFAPERTPR